MTKKYSLVRKRKTQLKEDKKRHDRVMEKRHSFWEF